MSDDVPFRLPPVDPSEADDVPSASLSPELLAGLLADGDDELAAWTLQHAMDESSRTAVYDGLLRDAMTLVGEQLVDRPMVGRRGAPRVAHPAPDPRSHRPGARARRAASGRWPSSPALRASST